jgi:hypothetical protein
MPLGLLKEAGVIEMTTELQVPAKKPERKNAKRPNAVRGLP